MLVDTSVWIEFFAKRSVTLSKEACDELTLAITEGEVCLVLPIYAELLSGTLRQDIELRQLLSSLRFIDLDWSATASWDDVAQLAQAAHARRLKIPGIVDRMIIASARQTRQPVWALDGPLRRLARAVGVVVR